MIEERSRERTSPDVVAIPAALFSDIKQLISDWSTSRQTAPQRSRELFLALAPENHSSPETLEPIIRQWVEIAGYFVGIAHENLKATSLPSDDELQAKFELLEWTLNALVGSFYEGLGALDDILEQANS
jgi:hypothetical protein